MKHIVALSMTGIILLLCCPAFGEKNLTIRLADGSARSFSLNSLRKLTFNGESMVATVRDASDETIDLSSLLQFKFSLTTPVEQVQASSLSVYPSPAINTLTVTRCDHSASKAVVYSLDGRVLLSVLLSGSECEINISSLTSGLYLLRVGRETIKFCKL